eukprot:XP_011666265.1 PREDICTED: cubilin-like [Strongylocentrotus purpuratus]
MNRYCGTKKPFAWVSETDTVTLEFITPYSLVFNRFLASYTTIDTKPSCYRFIDLTGLHTGLEADGITEVPLPQKGFLHSLNFPNAYPDNQNCEYVLHGNPEHRIVLYFDEFELEPGPACEADYVKVSSFLLRMYCRLVIDIEPDKRILLAFHEFTLEGIDLFSPSKTEEDVCLCGVLVEIRDDGGRMNRYCGTKKPFAWVSETDTVTLEFITPYSLVFNRFLASYTTIDTKPSCYRFIDLTGLHTGLEADGITEVPLPQKGFLHSLNFPNAYTDNQNCEYVLHGNPEHRIVLYFDECELEPGPACEADYVKVLSSFFAEVRGCTMASVVELVFLNKPRSAGVQSQVDALISFGKALTPMTKSL